MALAFMASIGSETAKPGTDSSVLALEAAVGDVVTFTLSVGAGQTLHAPVIMRQQNQTALDGDYEFAPDNSSATLSYTVTAESYGGFQASDTVAGKPVPADHGITLNPVDDKKPAKETTSGGSGGSDNDNPSEIAIGEVDRPFAYATLGFVVLVSAGIGFAVWSVVNRTQFSLAGASVPDDMVLDGTFGQRSASALFWFGAGVGAIVLVVGAWLATLETRGRLRAPIKGVDGSKGPVFGVGEAELKAIADILDKARRLRGSIAVVLAGFFILVISLWGMNALTADAPAPAPTVTVTSAPTASATSTAPPAH